MNDTYRLRYLLTQYHLRYLLTKVRRILPEHADCIEEARDRGANEGWLADARKQLNDAQEAVDAAEAWLHD